MKKLFLIPLLILVVTPGCKKETEQGSVLPTQPPSTVNIPPKVSTQADIQLVLPADSCILTGVVTATGSQIKSYLWERISGPVGYKIEHPDSLTSKVRALQEGTYTFQLTVTDSRGIKGKAVVAVIVTVPFEYDLNLDIGAGYKFLDDMEVCPWECYYADATEIAASYQMSPSHMIIMQLYLYEETDSAFQAYQVYNGFTTFRLSNKLYASGGSSFNLKKIIQQGGGSFSGTIKLTSSSALGTGRENAFKGLPPLTVTGKLDTTTHTVNIQIKGKIIF